MQDVIISIQPKWDEKIANGEKTVEVRKTRPKIKTPFKCYIYCTKAHKPRIMDHVFVYWDDDLAIIHTPYGVEIRNPYGSLGKDDELLNGKIIGEFICDRIDKYPYNKEFGYEISEESLNKTMLTADEFCNYGKGKPLYGWHISDLKIYDKPKELSEFNLKRPPQSWCYVKGGAQ